MGFRVGRPGGIRGKTRALKGGRASTGIGTTNTPSQDSTILPANSFTLFRITTQAPEGFSKTFFGYLVESDDAAHWIGRIECDGDLPAPDNRMVGYADDLYYGTADVSEAPPFMVTSATATINPQETDEFTILASIRNLALVNGQSVLFQAGLFADEIPVGKFQQEGQKYTYTGQKGGPGLSKLILDLEQGKATFIAKDIFLTGFSNPLPIRLATGEFDQCTMIVFDVEGISGRSKVQKTLLFRA